MTDRYQDFTRSAVGRLLVTQLGLPDPVPLERYTAGAPLVDGLVGVGGTGRIAESLPGMLDRVRIVQVAPGGANAQRIQGLVFDASGITTTEGLVALRDFFQPWLRSPTGCARIVVLGTPPELTDSSERIAQRALEGFTRSLGKEVGRGTTVQLVYVAPGAETAVTSTLAFLLSPKSAYVSGQVVRIGTRSTAAGEVADWLRPLAGKVALVTGASRGIGEQIARVLHRDGALVVGVDVPQAASELQAVTRELDGDQLTLDITAKDAPQRITRELLDRGLIHDNGSVVGVASIAGIAGNLGQTNYATSKAGVIGLVDSLSGELGNGITINAVAPGFIETQMTAAVPFATREVGRRLNAMSQGGHPVDVAETIAWFASPGSTAVTGNVVRVCGQMMLGA
ncbi:MAG: 3-oxoacyl-ACP reductase [Nocardioides sp.]